MRIRFRSILLGVLTLLVLLVLGAITAVGWQVVLGPKARPVTDRQFPVTPERMARGKYLADVSPCFSCHTEHDFSNPEHPRIEAKLGAGWTMPIPELNNLASRNITPDAETGIGTWSDDEIGRAIREGVRKNGEALFPVMPYPFFRGMTDEDVESLVVYLRTIPAVKNTVPARRLPPPLNILVKTMPEPLTAHAPEPPRTTPEARGEYLVRSVLLCAECHTPTNEKGQPLPGMEFAGGGSFRDPGQNGDLVFSQNITPDPSGIPHYDEAMFVNTLRTGKIPGRTLNHTMPFQNFKNLTDGDLHDVWSFLKTVPPVQHRISNTDPPTLCPLCGQRHGLGDMNRKKSD